MNIASVCTAILALLTGCSPCPCEVPADASTPVVRPARPLPPLEPDPQSLEIGDPIQPCGRMTAIVITWDGGFRSTLVPLPCKPYDPVRDLPYPQP